MKNVVIVLLLFLFCGCGKNSHKTYIADLKKIEKLQVLRVRVAETLTFETENSKQMYLVIGYGDFQIDFRKIEKEQIAERKVLLRMPSPIIDPIVDEEELRTYDRYTVIGYKDNKIKRMRELVDREARKVVLKSAQKEEYMGIAQKQTEDVLRKMLPDTEVTFKWDDGDAVKSYNYGEYEIRKTQHGAFEVFRQGASVGYFSMSKVDCEKWIKQNN